MPDFNIKPTHKPIKNYYAELEEYAQHGVENEGTVRAAFQNLLQHYCHQSNLTLLCEKTHYTAENRRIQPDGEVVDTYGLPHGYWEAKDTQDDLYAEADKKFAAGYPSKNIVIQSPTHALLYQHGRLQLDLDITEPRNLIQVLQTFFTYQAENISAWHTAVAEFKDTVPELGDKLAALIETERQNNPPYNMGQVNENDNNKNRKYETIDQRIADTYAKDSKATLRNKLSDPYIKAIRWASDRIGEEGVVAFVTNNGFLEGVAFDGMRKRLAEEFDTIYILDLGGNVRKNPKLSGTTHNVFGIQVGVSINFLIKKADNTNSQTQIFYACVDDFWRKEDKYDHLNSKQHYQNVEWTRITPDKRNTWLTEGLHAEFDTFIPMGHKAMKAAKGAATGVIFKTYSLGVSTNRDAWVYSFNRNGLTENVSRMIQTYNAEVARWGQRTDRNANLDDFVVSDDEKIKWSSTLKRKLQSSQFATFTDAKIRQSLYRPFTKLNLYFDRIMNDRVLVFPSIFPTFETEKENRVICVSGISSNKPFQMLMVDVIPDLHLTGDSQCFPFYTYDEDGTNRRENITDWALAQFRTHYNDNTITKWDIFHYNYGLLHHPEYREKYEANLKRDLPHIPFATDFWGFAEAGARLADLHVTYESQPEYDKLKFVQTPDVPLDWRVEKMKLSKDKTALIYNDFLTLSGIPPKVFDYRLGTRSALEWVVDQYRVKTDKRSGIVNDPNRADDPQYIVKLIGKVITVSLETVEIVSKLPALEIK